MGYPLMVRAPRQATKEMRDKSASVFHIEDWEAFRDLLGLAAFGCSRPPRTLERHRDQSL